MIMLTARATCPRIWMSLCRPSGAWTARHSVLLPGARCPRRLCGSPSPTPAADSPPWVAFSKGSFTPSCCFQVELNLLGILHFSLTNLASLGQLSFMSKRCAYTGGVGGRPVRPDLGKPLGVGPGHQPAELTKALPQAVLHSGSQQPSQSPWPQSPAYSPPVAMTLISHLGVPWCFTQTSPCHREGPRGAGGGGMRSVKGWRVPGTLQRRDHICFISVYNFVSEPLERKLGKTLSKLRIFLLCNYIPLTCVTKPSVIPKCHGISISWLPCLTQKVFCSQVVVCLRV